MASPSEQTYYVECVNLSSDQLADFIAKVKEQLTGYTTGPRQGGELDLESTPPRDIVPLNLYAENGTGSEEQIKSAFQQAVAALRLQSSNQLTSIKLFNPAGQALKES